MAFIDGGGERHHPDRRDAQMAEVVDHRRVGERGQRAALLGRDRGVPHGETAQVEFVDQLAAPEEGRQGGAGQWRLDTGAGHDIGRVLALRSFDGAARRAGLP